MQDPGYHPRNHSDQLFDGQADQIYELNDISSASVKVKSSFTAKIETVQAFVRVRPPFQDELDDHVFDPTVGQRGEKSST